MPRQRIPARTQRGAALLLLLLVLGFGAATVMMKSFDENAEAGRQRKTLKLLAEARDAVLGYAMLHERLPRPAQPGTDGQESNEICTSDTSCSGLIPWATLGIEGVDGWGKLIRYSVTPAYTVAPLVAGQSIANKRVVGRAPGGSVFYRAGHEQCDQQNQCVPAVIFSNGKNNLGFGANGLPLANVSVTNVDEVTNNEAITTFYSRPADQNPNVAGGEFDDLVIWVNLVTPRRQMTIDNVRMRY